MISTSPIDASVTFSVERAQVEDCDELLRLYLMVYGANYPLSFGNNRNSMLAAMTSEKVLWLVARESGTGRPIGCVVFEIDPIGKIGKVAGLVINPDYRRLKMGSVLVSTGTAQLLGPQGPVNSIYTTTRTNAVSPQLICLRDGFIPLGIFPNAHKLKTYETLTLMAKFKPGAFERRAHVDVVPQRLSPILDVLKRTQGLPTETIVKPVGKPTLLLTGFDPLEFEFVDAPSYVLRKFMDEMSDPYDRFYPFHTPNFMMVSKDGAIRIYAYFSKADRYCAIVGLNVSVQSLAGRFGGLLEQLKDLGISYLELLMDLQFTQSIEAALQANFLPSAIYPAMREDEDGMLHDFVILSRTMETLNFQGMHIDRAFKPYIDQYLSLWKEMHLESLEVHNSVSPNFIS